MVVRRPFILSSEPEQGSLALTVHRSDRRAGDAVRAAACRAIVEEGRQGRLEFAGPVIERMRARG